MTETVTTTAISSQIRNRARQRTYVLDTSVLLSDPRALYRFAEHAVALPVIVLNELEKKRHDPELGHFARRALRELDDLRARHERLDIPVPLTREGGTLHIEMSQIDEAELPRELRLGDNDTRILAVALNLSQAGFDVTVVSKDLPLRLKAAAIGLGAEEYRAEQVITHGYSGVDKLAISQDQITQLWDEGRLVLP